MWKYNYSDSVYPLVFVHIRIYVPHIHTQTHMHTRAQMHACIHTRTHTHTGQQSLAEPCTAIVDIPKIVGGPIYNVL